MDLLPLRLSPGVDLRRALEEAGLASAFVVSGLGSLVDVQLRFAGGSDATLLPGTFELLSLSGAITRNGAHLHMAISDAAGRVYGGHVAYGNCIRTTAEILLAVTADFHLSREFDAATGYAELVVRPAVQAP